MTRVKQLRESIGMKQYELAARVGVKPASVFKWENDMGFPSAENLLVLADIFNVSTDYILGREPVQDGQNTA